ncbi:MAG: hydroxyacid dehydrogenase [Ahrensia sp.]|nr:hydroxyacid dehydrogenase [Ahrensia sp.]
MTPYSHLIEKSREILGDGGIVEVCDAADFLKDSVGPGLPCLFVARPKTTEQMSRIVSLCRAHGVAIVPQGGNSNVCAMAVPTEEQPTILLSLSRMNAIIEINPARSTVTVEAGCIMEVLQDAVAEHGLAFAPDWGARGTATVGGAVATNGGGLNVLRFGTTREQVLGMEVVMADGRVWNGLRALVKDNSGYDLKHLFVGSEGTLGIITKLMFRLHPAQPLSQSMFASLSDKSRVTEFLAMARSIAGERLTAFELLPGLGVEKALERYPDLRRPCETRADWYILVRMSDREKVDEKLATLFEMGFETGIIDDAVMASSDAQEKNLWEIREQMIPHQYFGAYKMMKWDVSIPVDEIMAFLAEAEATIASISERAFSYAVGHVGDGNIHLSAYLERTDDADSISARIYEQIDSLIWEFGGSIVAEHGVGSLYRDRVQRQKSQLEYEMLQRLKQCFDPEGLFNPGKLVNM